MLELVLKYDKYKQIMKNISIQKIGMGAWALSLKRFPEFLHFEKSNA